MKTLRNAASLVAGALLVAAVPAQAEITVQTHRSSEAECVNKILTYLQERGYIAA